MNEICNLLTAIKREKNKHLIYRGFKIHCQLGSPNRWKSYPVQGLSFRKGAEGGVVETFCTSLFTESRSSSINLFTLASYLCTGLFSQSWYWKVSAYLLLFISLFWCFPVIFWHEICELLWGLRLQLSALCRSLKWPSLPWLLSWGWTRCLCSSAVLPTHCFQACYLTGKEKWSWQEFVGWKNA